MWWQKASARTVPVTRPFASRTQDRSSSVRMVVAPSRFLQNDAKSWRPSRSVDAALIASTSRGRGQASTWLRVSGSTAAGSSAIR